jgi:hypothetical protein
MDEELIRKLVDRTADLSIGPSTVRNQGASGVVVAARRALRRVDLQQFRNVSSTEFTVLLEQETQLLRKRLPANARHWGTARKCLNIFLRDVLYSRFLCDHYRFHRIESILEIPLDSHVASGLKNEVEGLDLPRWRTIKSLSPQASELYQTAARQVAKRERTHAVHLDLAYWRAT